MVVYNNPNLRSKMGQNTTKPTTNEHEEIDKDDLVCNSDIDVATLSVTEEVVNEVLEMYGDYINADLFS